MLFESWEWNIKICNLQAADQFKSCGLNVYWGGGAGERKVWNITTIKWLTLSTCKTNRDHVTERESKKVHIAPKMRTSSQLSQRSQSQSH